MVKKKERKKVYSYRRASTGRSLDALQAGYNAKITLTPIPKANAPPNTVGDRTGVMVKAPAPCVWPSTNRMPFAKPQPIAMPATAPINPMITDSPKEYGQHCSAFHAQRFEDANFACAFNEGDNHYVHYAYACNEQRNCCDSAEKQGVS